MGGREVDQIQCPLSYHVYEGRMLEQETIWWSEWHDLVSLVRLSCFISIFMVTQIVTFLIASDNISPSLLVSLIFPSKEKYLFGSHTIGWNISVSNVKRIIYQIYLSTIVLILHDQHDPPILNNHADHSKQLFQTLRHIFTTFLPASKSLYSNNFERQPWK